MESDCHGVWTCAGLPSHVCAHTRYEHWEREQSLWVCPPFPAQVYDGIEMKIYLHFLGIWQKWIESQRMYFGLLDLPVEYFINLSPFAHHMWYAGNVDWKDNLKGWKFAFLWYEFAFPSPSFSYDITVLLCDLIMIPPVSIKLISSQF